MSVEASNSAAQSFLNKSRQDKFLLVLALPKAFLKLNPDVPLRDLQISIYGSPVPKVSIPSTEAPYFGQQLKVTSQARTAYDPITVNFTIDNEFKNYWVLWKWLDLINDSQESGMNPYFEKYKSTSGQDSITKIPYKNIINKQQGDNIYFDYMTNITIFGLDEYNNKRIQFTYTNAFLTDLSEISYNYRTVGELESTATFAFNQMHVELTKEC